MKIAIIIPARFQSSRFPGKPLALINGKPMILHTAERSALAYGKDSVWIATDSDNIAQVCKEHGFQVIITSPNCLTGTDRVAEASLHINADIYVNVQGDEPLVDPDDIKKVVQAKIHSPNSIINAMAPIGPLEDPSSIHIPKVVTNEQGRLIYMSRLPIPGFKSPEHAPTTYYKQICIYAFNKSELQAFHKYGRKSSLEEKEDIEILRFHELCAIIDIITLTSTSLAVDIPDDIIKIENYINETHKINSPTNCTPLPHYT